MKPPGMAARLHCQHSPEQHCQQPPALPPPPLSSHSSRPPVFISSLLANDSVLPFCSRSVSAQSQTSAAPLPHSSRVSKLQPEPRMEPPARAAQRWSSFTAHKPQLPALPPHPVADSSPSRPWQRSHFPAARFQALTSLCSAICDWCRNRAPCNNLKSALSPSV